MAKTREVNVDIDFIEGPLAQKIDSTYDFRNQITKPLEGN